MPDPVPVMLMVRQLGPGGTERQLAETARGLDPSRFRVHVGCFHEGVRAQELREAGIPVLRLPVTSYMKPGAATGGWRLGRYFVRNKIRVLHTFDYSLACFGVPVARTFGVPVVLTSQRAQRYLVPRLYLRLLRVAERIASGIVVNSESVRREVVAEHHVPADRVHLCYNGIDVSRFHPGGRPRITAFRGASLVIGVVCLLRPEKGLPLLLRAFAQLCRAHAGIRLVIVGDGPELPGLQSLARELGIHDQCLFQPAVADVAPWLRTIDVFVLPSLSEALSNSLMEAMACGCSCIASSTGGNPELIRPGETGLLFEPGNVDDLVRQLSALVGDPGLRSRVSEAAVREIRDRFSLQIAARRMAEIYASYLA